MLLSCKRGRPHPYGFSGFKHIFRKDGVALGGIIDQHVGNSTDELTVLDNGTAAHECVKQDTTN